MPWEAIKYVSSGVTLLAFIAAVILAIYRRTLLSRERLIELAPADQRAKLVKATLQEFFDVDTDRMSENHAYQLAVEQIRARTRRYLINAFVLLAIVGGSALVAIASFVNRPVPLDDSGGPIKESTFSDEHVSLKRLPPAMLEAVEGQTTAKQTIQSLRKKGSLSLDNACVVLGDPADPPRTVALSLYALTLTRSACILTNGNSLDLTVVELSGAGGTIESFDAKNLQPADASAGTRGADGRTGGTVSLRVLGHVVGPLTARLRGQNGGRGGQGGNGGPGLPGNRGADAVKGLFDCRAGGGNGTQGGPGSPGGQGLPGGNGGAGGTLILRGIAVTQQSQIIPDLQGGSPGTGGPGGIGGLGGPGGQGGSGDGFCSGGRAGDTGRQGDPGSQGPVGLPGANGNLKPDDVN